MPTLLLSPRHSEDTRILWKAAINSGWKVQRVHNWQVPEIDDPEIAIYGEPLLCRLLSQKLNLAFDEPPLDWLPNLPYVLRKREVRLATLKEARAIIHPAFIKPADEKGLEAKIYHSGADLPGPDLYNDDLPVLVQEIVQWRSEFRCFVLGASVLTAAPYWLDHKLAQDEHGNWLNDVSEPSEAVAFCQSILREPGLKHPRAFVLDVGEITGKGWAAIEANAAFSSGIYGCDPRQALEVIHNAVKSKA